MAEKYPVRHSVFLSESMAARLADWAKANGHKVPEALRMLITRQLEPGTLAVPSLADDVSAMHGIPVLLPRGLVRAWLGEAALHGPASEVEAEVIRLIEEARSSEPAVRSAALRQAQVLEYLFVAVSNLIHQQHPGQDGKILDHAQARVLQHWSHLLPKGGARAKP